jgi:hypothetical protein
VPFGTLAFKVVDRVTILERGRVIGGGHRVNGAGLRQKGAPGLLLLPPDAVPPLGKRVENYQLSGDGSGATAEYKYEYGHSSNIEHKIGVKAFGADIKLVAQTQLCTSITLAYGLRGGFDYELFES